MSIIQGQNAEASDFINESERDGTKANDAGRVAKLESDGFLTPAFIRDVSARVKRSADFQLAAAAIDCGIDWNSEDFDTHAAHDNTLTDSTALYNYPYSGSDGSITLDATTDWAYGSFTTPNDGAYRVLKTIRPALAGISGSSHTARMLLRTNPTGSNLATSEDKTFSNSAIADGPTFNISAVLAPNTTYYFVLQHVTDGGNSIGVGTQSGVGGAGTSNNSGSSWTTQTYGINAVVTTTTSRHLATPATGKYLINVNIRSGSAANKLLKLWANATLIAAKNADGSSADAGVSLSTIYQLTAGDFVFPTLQVASSDTDDVDNEGSYFEMIRLR